MPVWSSLTFKLQPNECLDTPHTYNILITTVYTLLYTVLYSVLYTVLYIEVCKDFISAFKLTCSLQSTHTPFLLEIVPYT